jgi:hypothetical protein
VSDIDTGVVDSLKALDPERPIREADVHPRSCYVAFVPEPGSCTATNKVKGSSNFKRPIHVHICAVPRLNASCACGERTPENLMEGVYAACRQPKIWRVCFSYALKTASIEACANQVSRPCRRQEAGCLISLFAAAMW